MFSASVMASTSLVKLPHQLAVGMGVKVGQGQGLQMGEEVLPDLCDHLLGGVDHQLVVAQCAESPQGVHRPHAQYGPAQSPARSFGSINSRITGRSR